MTIVNDNEFKNILIGTDFDDLILGGFDADILIGGLGNDILAGGDGDDILLGGGGDDYLDGGNGSDILIGGDGNDIYIVNSLEDIVLETSAFGEFDAVYSFVSYKLGNDVEILTLLGNENLSGWGNNLNNVLLGNAGSNWLFGLDGNDLFLSSEGDDIIYGGAGNDAVDYSSAGVDITLRDARVADKENLGADLVIDVEIIVGAVGQRNRIDFTEEFRNSTFAVVNLEQEFLRIYDVYFVTDQVLTVRNFSEVVGTSNNDSIVGNALSNFIWGGAGSDFVDGGSGDDEIWGEVGDDFIFGGIGSDRLVGGDGRDVLNAYGFTLGGEIDTLRGGSGSDTFVLGDENNGCYYLEPLVTGNLDFSYAIIEDWNAREDFIQLSARFQYSIEFRSEFGVGSAALDTIIFSGVNIIAVLQDSTDFSVSRDLFLV